MNNANYKEVQTSANTKKLPCMLGTQQNMFMVQKQCDSLKASTAAL